MKTTIIGPARVPKFATANGAQNKSKIKRSVILTGESGRLGGGGAPVRNLNAVVCAEALSGATILPERGGVDCDWATSGPVQPPGTGCLRDAVGGRKRGSRVRRLRHARRQPASVSFRAAMVGGCQPHCTFVIKQHYQPLIRYSFL